MYLNMSPEYTTYGQKYKTAYTYSTGASQLWKPHLSKLSFCADLNARGGLVDLLSQQSEGDFYELCTSALGTLTLCG